MIKKLSWLLESDENFKTLVGYVLLFDNNSEYYNYSGLVRIAVLDYGDVGENLSAITIQVGTKLYPIIYKRETLIEMFSKCIEAVGTTAEESFTIEIDL